MTGGERERGEQQEMRVGANQAPSCRALSPRVRTVSSTQQRNAEEIQSGRAAIRPDDDRKKRNQVTAATSYSALLLCRLGANQGLPSGTWGTPGWAEEKPQEGGTPRRRDPEKEDSVKPPGLGHISDVLQKVCM